MTVNKIKKLIKHLSPGETTDLAAWLNDLDQKSWDKQIETDIARLGKDEFKRILSGNITIGSRQKQAALRLLNNLRFDSSANLDQCLADMEILIGESLTGC